MNGGGGVEGRVVVIAEFAGVREGLTAIGGERKPFPAGCGWSVGPAPDDEYAAITQLGHLRLHQSAGGGFGGDLNALPAVHW